MFVGIESDFEITMIFFFMVCICRHVKMSLELLLKFVACFGPTIRSTISAPPAVGVDLHQEERYILLPTEPFCIPCFLLERSSVMEYAIALVGPSLLENIRIIYYIILRLLIAYSSKFNRIACCKESFIQLQQIQGLLPALARYVVR